MLGLTAGFCLQIPGASTAVGRNLFAGHLLLLCTQLAIVTAGVGVLTAGLATAAATARRRPSGRLLALAGAVLAAAVALTTALSVMGTVLVDHLRWGSTTLDRFILIQAGGIWVWRLAPLMVLIGCVLAAPAYGPAGIVPARRAARALGRILPRECRRVIAAAGIVGGAGAALSWQLRISPALSEDRLYVLVAQRWWICAFAGWAAAVVVLLTGRAGTRTPQDVPTPPLARLPAALTAGFLTAAAAGLVQFCRAAAARYGRNLDTFVVDLRMPMWLLFVMMVVSLPWLPAAAGRNNRDRRQPRPAAAGVFTVLAAGLTVGALTVALLSGILAPLTVAPYDYSQSKAILAKPWQASTVPPIPVAPVHDPRRTSEPGRSLDQATATTALANIPRLLPAGQKVVGNDNNKLPKMKPAACRALLVRDTAAEQALPRTATITRTYTFPAHGTSDDKATLVLTLTSYVTPVRDFASDRNETVRCRHFTFPDAGLQASFTDGAPPDLPYPAYRQDLTFTGRVHSMSVVTTGLTDSVLIGHNRISANIIYGYIDVPPPATLRSYLEHLAMTAIITIIEALRSATPR